jgi:hypothetical protein
MESGFGRLRPFAERSLIREPTEAITSVTGDRVSGARTVEIRKGRPCLSPGRLFRARTTRFRLEPWPKTGTSIAIARAARLPILAERRQKRQEAEILLSARPQQLRRPSLIRAPGRAGGPWCSAQLARPSRLRSRLNAAAGSRIVGPAHVSAPRRTPRAHRLRPLHPYP